MAVTASLNYSQRLSSPAQPVAPERHYRANLNSKRQCSGKVVAGANGTEVRLACANGTRTAPGKIMWRGQCIEESAILQVR